jgi:hypothetical protein
MKTLRTLGVLAVTASAFALVPATSAMAAHTGDTTATFSLTGGTLDISVVGTATLTNGASGATSVSGSLGAVGVDDARGGSTGWTASADSTSFTEGTVGAPVSSGVSYTTNTVGSTGTVTVMGSTGQAVDAVSAVVAATAVTGNNTASWTPDVTVALPSNALAGDYTGTVTTSVL